MSPSPISRSPDLKALLDDGYEIEIKAGHLVIHNVPYVTADKQVKRGKLVSVLDLAGDETIRPSTHIALFAGEFPCDKDGRPLRQLEHQSRQQTIAGDLLIDHSFSNKPKEGYNDYYVKMTTYVAVISGPAEAIDPHATARTYAVIASVDPDAVFHYIDNASSRAGISAIFRKLELPKLAIIGGGGTGAYILDLVAKTPVREIHLYDKDDFLQHNAFRTPGAATIDELKARRKKVHHLADIYSGMHRGIAAHPYDIDASNIHELQDMAFVFVCVDNGAVKRPIVEGLEQMGIPFIDVGMGLELVDEQLRGILRVTLSTERQRDHVHSRGRISFAGSGADDVYSKSIQVADLNALNAALAVIKFKKHFGFYSDLENEHFCTYTLDGNLIHNEDKE